MGRGSPKTNLPSRPRLSWDNNSVPWTDLNGGEEDYANTVQLWSSFHNMLPDSNSNNIVQNLCGVVLNSQLYGHAKDLFLGIYDPTILSEHGMKKILALLGNSTRFQ